MELCRTNKANRGVKLIHVLHYDMNYDEPYGLEQTITKERPYQKSWMASERYGRAPCMNLPFKTFSMTIGCTRPQRSAFSKIL